MSDKKIKCQDCGKEFIFTESEQAFFSEKGFEDRKRCNECSRARKANRSNYKNDRRAHN